MGRGPGPVVSGSHRKIFELRGEPSQILRGKRKGVHAGICTGLRGHSRENGGGSCKMFQR